MDQWFNDTVHDTPKDKDSFDFSSIKKLDDLVSAYHAGRSPSSRPTTWRLRRAGQAQASCCGTLPHR